MIDTKFSNTISIMGESTDAESTDGENLEVDISNSRKCVRKGDTIYYSKPENINMIGSSTKMTTVSKSSTPTSRDTETRGDRVLTGESLYKVSS